MKRSGKLFAGNSIRLSNMASLVTCSAHNSLSSSELYKHFRGDPASIFKLLTTE